MTVYNFEIEYVMDGKEYTALVIGPSETSAVARIVKMFGYDNVEDVKVVSKEVFMSYMDELPFNYVNYCGEC